MTVSTAQHLTATTNGETVSDIVTELREIYTVHNPTKLPGLPALIEKYAGREAAVLARVRSKYGVAAGGAGGHSVTRREIEKLYSKYEPASLGQVGTLIAKHGEPALLDLVRQRFASAAPARTSSVHVERGTADEHGPQRYGGAVLTEQRDGSFTLFKMQMAMADGSKVGYLLQRQPLTAAAPRFEVTVVTGESGRIEDDERKLAQMSELERKRYAEKMLKMVRTEEELRDTSDISYAQQESLPPDMRIGLGTRGFDFGQDALGRGGASACHEARGEVRSRTAGRSEFSAAEPFAAGDVVGCEALFDEEGRYAGAVAFDVNGAPPQRLAHRLSDDELAAGALCPAVTLGRGDRVQINFCRPEITAGTGHTPAASPVADPPDGTFRPVGAEEAAVVDETQDEGYVSFSCPKAAAVTVADHGDRIQLEPHEVLVCPDQSEWLQTMMRRYGYGSVSQLLAILIIFCNREAKSRKSV